MKVDDFAAIIPAYLLVRGKVAGTTMARTRIESRPPSAAQRRLGWTSDNQLYIQYNI